MKSNCVVKRIFLLQIHVIVLIAIMFCTLHNSSAGEETIGSSAVSLPASAASELQVPLASISQEISTEISSAAFRISATGDIMMHQRQLDTHFEKELNAYVFDDDYVHIKDRLLAADILIGNLETTFAGPEKKYSGYPLFNTPDSLGEALKRAGFDVLTAANNHCLDTGVEGLKRTARVLGEMGFGVIGTRAKPEDKASVIIEKNGMKVGILGYTYETGRRGKNRTLNGNLMPVSAEPLIDSFSPAHVDEALAEMKKRVVSLKNDGAELIVMYLHWGAEYGPKPLAYQHKMAENLASAGVDIIFGSHPHVVQTASFIKRADGRKTFVAWSLGNFISNQRYEFLERHDTEDGLVVSVDIDRDNSGLPVIKNVEYQPIWVHRHNRGGKWLYHILPLPQALKKPEPYNFDSSNLKRAQNSLKRTQQVLSDAPGFKLPEE